MGSSNCHTINEILQTKILKVLFHDGYFYVFVNPETRNSGGTYKIDINTKKVEKITAMKTLELWNTATELTPDEFRKIIN